MSLDAERSVTGEHAFAHTSVYNACLLYQTVYRGELFRLYRTLPLMSFHRSVHVTPVLFKEQSQ